MERRPPTRRTIYAVVDEWCAWMDARGMSPRTTDQYWRYVHAAGQRAVKDPRDFTERDVVTVVRSYPAQGGSRGMAIRAMRSFFSWAEDHEMMVNPAARISVPRSKFGPAPRLDPAELEAVFQAAERIDPRARPTLELLYYTGARVGSMVAAKPEHVRFDRSGRPSIYFETTKGDRPYEVPIEADQALSALTRLVELIDYKPRTAVARRPTLVGVGEARVWQWANAAGRAAGVRTFPHLLRHTFLSDLAQDPEVDIRTWTELANHADGSLLRRYAATSEPRIRSAVGRLGIPQPADTAPRT